MRNGVFRYVSHDFDNVERIEIVKGPASVFFGQGYPGGVINFITKRGEFRNIPTTITDQHDAYGGERVLIDQNTMLSKKAAIRFVGGWEDTKGERRFEYRKGFTANPSLTLNPLDSGRIKINLMLNIPINALIITTTSGSTATLPAGTPRRRLRRIWASSIT